MPEGNAHRSAPGNYAAEVYRCKALRERILGGKGKGKGPHPTLGMPTQLPELKRASQYLSYRNLKAALDLWDRAVFRHLCPAAT